MPSTPTSSAPSPVGRRKVTALAAGVGLALVLMLVLGGCTTTSEKLTPRVESNAREQMAIYHAATISCIHEVLYAGVDVSDADLPASIEACFKTSTVGLSDSDLKTGGYSFTHGTWLRSVFTDVNHGNTRHIMAMDVGSSEMQEDLVTVDAYYAQCWSSTIDFGARDMTPPEREECSADLMRVLPRNGEQLDTLVTVAPDDNAGG